MSIMFTQYWMKQLRSHFNWIECLLNQAENNRYTHLVRVYTVITLINVLDQTLFLKHYYGKPIGKCAKRVTEFKV